MKTREELLKNGHSLDADSMIYSERLVKAILATPTEEQMKCEYCHAPLSGREWSKLEYCNELRKHSNLCGDVLIHVHFCQFCGRKLGDERNAQKS